MEDQYGNDIEDAIRESGYSIRKIDESALLAELARLRADAERWRKVVEIVRDYQTADTLHSTQEVVSAVAKLIKDSSHA